MKEFAVEPPKAALSNMETGEVMRFQFNPPELVEEISANWARLSPIGLSHQILHYISTNNHRMPIEIYLSDILANLRIGMAAPFLLTTPGPFGISIPRVSTSNLKIPEREGDLDGMKRFLQSLLYPHKTDSGSFSPPPRVLFVWPSVVRLRCIVTSLRFTHRRFSLKTAATTALMAEVELEESRFTPISSQHVRQFGSRRTP